MDKDKINLIIGNIELLVQSLKEEIGVSSEHNYEEIVSYFDEGDVDEFYEEVEKDV